MGRGVLRACCFFLPGPLPSWHPQTPINREELSSPALLILIHFYFCVQCCLCPTSPHLPCHYYERDSEYSHHLHSDVPRPSEARVSQISSTHKHKDNSWFAMSSWSVYFSLLKWNTWGRILHKNRFILAHSSNQWWDSLLVEVWGSTKHHMVRDRQHMCVWFWSLSLL